MKTFIALLKINLKMSLQYRWGYLMSVLIDPIVLLMNIALFSSIFAYKMTDNILGYSLSRIIWYFSAATFLWYLINAMPDYRLSERILNGDLTVDLIRPTTVFRLELSNAIAMRSLGFLMEFIPSLFVFWLILRPDFLTLVSLWKFLSCAVFSFTLFFFMNFLLGLSSFYIKSINSLRNLKYFILGVTAGSNIPLEFFPVWYQKINDFFPFKYLFYWPVQFFLNRPESNSLAVFIKVVLCQAAWCLFFYFVCKLAWKHVAKHYCAAGG